MTNLPPWCANAINRTPRRIRQAFYSWGGWIDALNPPEVLQLNSEIISQWAVSLYSSRTYNGVMFGSSNGAAIHLAAALGMPWLPQTYLVAVRRLLRPDQIHKDIRWGEQVIRPFLNQCPDIHAAQMHDPVQDRLMVSKMGYFRLKLLGLPGPLKRFIAKNTGEKKPLISIECSYSWPSLSVGQRHSFQLGGFGAIDPYEYLRGSDRTRTFLEKVRAPVKHWETFEPSGELPEAEWGFYQDSLQQLQSAAQENGAPFYRLIFDHPEGLSTFTCDLYRWWYQKRLGFTSRRMVIENFALVAPYRALRSGVLPFWLAFNTENSADRIENYLTNRAAFDELYLLLMSNGVTEGIGLTTIERWRKILKFAAKQGRFIGVDEREYPLDFGTFMRYHQELQELLPDQYPVPEPLSIEEVKEFLAQFPQRYPLRLETASKTVSAEV